MAMAVRRIGRWALAHGVRGVLPIAVLGVVAACGFASVPAEAAFVRRFVRAISSTGSGPLSPSGVAVGAGDELWVESAKDSLVGFAPAYPPGENQLLQTLPASPPIEGPVRLEQLAIQRESKDFYVAGRTPADEEVAPVVVYDSSGAIREVWEQQFQAARIAIDNSAAGSLEDPSACGTAPLAPGECFVYVTSTGEAGGIEKFDSKGTPVPFTATAPYIDATKANKITGIPGREKGVFGGAGLNGVAVDAQGDIFADNAEARAVYEYAPSGAFLREFSLASSEVPRLDETIVQPDGVAVDPASGHLLVSVEANGREVGAIDEFDPATGKFVAETTQAASGEKLTSPRQLATDSQGDLYVSERHDGAVDVYGPGRFLPTVTLGPATERTATSALLTASINPEGFKLTECRFQYVSEEAFAKEGFTTANSAECEPNAGEIPANSETHAVSGQATGLTAGVTYRYRLLAHSEGALGGSVETPALAFTAPGPPNVLSSSAANVSSTGAQLQAQIKPDGAATSYHFEYDTRPYSGEERHGTNIPIPDASIGSGGATGGATESVVQDIEGLTPGSEYHFRVLAENEAGVTPGPDQTFATLPASSTSLPDGRAFELVTPASRQGGSDMFAEPEGNHEFSNEHDVGTPALAGSDLEFKTLSTFGAFPGAFLEGHYAFHRDPAHGWGFTALESPTLGVQTAANVIFDPVDLSHVAFEDKVGAEAGEQGVHSLDLVGAPGGPYTQLHEDPPHTRLSTRESLTTEVLGASRDLSHLVLDSNNTTTCGPEQAAKKITHGDELCEWSGGTETLEDGETRPQLSLVNLAPESETEPTSTCGAILGGGRTAGLARNAVSADGTRIFFTAPQVDGHERGLLSGPGCWNPEQETITGKAVNPPQLYLRAAGQTLKLSAPAPGALEGGTTPREYPAAYVGASADGTRAFFISEAWLTADHPDVHDRELYECQITIEGEQPTCKLTRLSIPLDEHGEPNPQAGAQVDWVPAISTDGSTVYYTAFNVLADGAIQRIPPNGGEDVNSHEGEVNVYRYDSAGLDTSYVAAVETRDYTDQPHCAAFEEKTYVGPCSAADWYTTPDGRFLLFGASIPVAGFNTAKAGCTQLLPFEQNFSDGRCSELYRYDAAAADAGEQAFVCVSCGAGGVDSAGNAEFARSATLDSAAAPPAGISDGGRFVFFDSPATLVPQARTHTLHVYEWQAQGVDGCGLALGCVRLLSSPNDPAPSYFLGSSNYHTPDNRRVDGGNVFIGTHASLVAQDTNALGDIYDVRICEAESPCIQPPVGETVQCEGGSCQSPPAPPNDATPGSLTFSGVGNLASEPPLKPKPLTRAQKLARALKLCRKDRSKKKRTTCIRAAHRKYGSVRKPKKPPRVGARR